jgi:hypothetical protein
MRSRIPIDEPDALESMWVVYIAMCALMLLAGILLPPIPLP